MKKGERSGDHVLWRSLSLLLSFTRSLLSSIFLGASSARTLCRALVSVCLSCVFLASRCFCCHLGSKKSLFLFVVEEILLLLQVLLLHVVFAVF